MHLNGKASTGYMGVSCKKGRYQVALWIDGKNKHYGTFDTAVEAAVAYAKSVEEGGVAGDAKTGRRI